MTSLLGFKQDLVIPVIGTSYLMLSINIVRSLNIFGIPRTIYTS